MSESSGWYVNMESGPDGPLEAVQIRARLAAGKITPEYYVWRDGMAEWRPLSEFPELAYTPKPAAPEPPPVERKPEPPVKKPEPKPAPSAAAQPAEKKARRGPSPAFIIILVAILAGFGWLMYLKQSDPKQFSEIIRSVGLDPEIFGVGEVEIIEAGK